MPVQPMTRFIWVAMIQAATVAQVNQDDTARSATTEPPAVLFDLAAVAGAGPQLLGREVSLRDLRVGEKKTRGFWVTATGHDAPVFVLPAEGELVSVATNDLVNIHGDVRRLSPDQTLRLGLRPETSLFIYAYTVRPAVVSGSQRHVADAASGPSR